MRAKSLVICDAEQEYAKGLMQAFSARKDLGLSLHLFQQLEELEEFAKKTAIHILLLGAEFSPDRRMNICAQERYVLVKEQGEQLMPGEKQVYKYQASDRILASILQECADGGEFIRKGCSMGGQLIGIYSPIHRIGKTRYAFDLAKELAEQGAVLYINLEEYSGGDYYFTEIERETLGDLLYYSRQEKGNLGLKISAMAGRAGDLDYISPMQIMQDLRAVTAEEWLELFKTIFEHTVYQSVILDLGEGIQGLYPILQACHVVYTPYIEEPAAMAKLRQYTENLRRTGYEQVLEHTVQKLMRQKAGEQ